MKPRKLLQILLWSLLAVGGPYTASEASTPADREAFVSASDTRFDGPESARTREEDLREMTGAAALFPESYEVLWRAARAAWAVGDRLDDGRDSARLERLGLQALQWAERAVSVRPEGIEARFYRGLATSTYARGIGMFRALLKGLSGKFEADMEWVVRKDPSWGYGAGYRALGRYYFSIPRPKRDLRRSEALLRESLKVSPGWLRTRLYLADTLFAQGRRIEAQREYRAILEESSHPGEENELETVRADARKGLEELSP